MPLQILPIPAVPYFKSKLRIYRAALNILNQELLQLEAELHSREIEQLHYDDSVIAIERDLRHIRREIAKLTEIRPSYLKWEAA